ncbi:MAG: hypothetical protein JO345_23385 [Streptosporangiaceae bacterium]|nr:hypothetical protein [Streptosporangiaceae bacterium]
MLVILDNAGSAEGVPEAREIRARLAMAGDSRDEGDNPAEEDGTTTPSPR